MGAPTKRGAAIIIVIWAAEIAVWAIIIAISPEVPSVRIGIWHHRKRSKRNCRASEQSKGFFHRGSSVAPRSIPSSAIVP